MEWVDDWLEGLVHRSGRNDLTERFRHERFIVSRTVSTVVALAAVPPYLIGRGSPTALEALGLAVLLVPLAAVAMLSRTGRLDAAQACVSAALALFVAGAGASFGQEPSFALLAFALVPLDALLCGNRRAIGASILFVLFGVLLMIALQATGIGAGERTALATVFAVGLAMAIGHAAAQAVGDCRLKAHLKAALRAGEARESVALQSIDDLVTWHDRNGSVTRANAGGAKLAGAAASTLQGRGLFGRIHVADRPAYLKAISDAASASEPVVVQFRLSTGENADAAIDQNPVLARIGSRRAQDLVWVEMRAHRLKQPGDDGATVVAVTRSIAAHKQHAEELETLHRAAKRAGEDRAQLLATVSHELRTPLNALIGYAELLKGKESGNPLAHDYADIIHSSGQHMLGVVSTLLDLSTIEAGGRDLEPEPLDVTELVQDCCRTMTLTAERAGVVIAQSVTPNLPELWADRRACQQILLNLLSNAVKFTPRGGLVTVEAKRESDRIAFTVRDTGIGVLAAELPRLGNPFYRAASGRGQAENGNGLGLSVVRGLVGLHQGRINIASAPGNGMKVTVSLPLEAGGPKRDAPPLVQIDRRPTEGALALKTG